MDRIKVNLMVGRFQPLTLGHMKCVDYAWKEKGLPTIMAMINTKDEKVDDKHPFPSSMILPMYQLVLSRNKKVKDIILVKNANIVEIGEELWNQGYEIASWACGTDRLEAYKKMSNKYATESHLSSDFTMLEVPRSDEDISATKVRKALLDGDKKNFNKLTPLTTLQGHLSNDNNYQILRKQIQKVMGVSESLENVEPVNEVIGLVIALGMLAWGCAPFFATVAKNVNNGKSNKEDSGTGLFDWFFHHEDYKLNKKEKQLDRKDREMNLKEREEAQKKREEAANKSTDELRDTAVLSIGLAQKMNNEKEDETTTKLITALSSSLYDKDGKPVPTDQVAETLNKSLPDDLKAKDLSKKIQDAYVQVEKDPKLQKLITQKQEDLTEDDIKELEKSLKELSQKYHSSEEEVDDSDLNDKLSQEEEDDIKNSTAKGSEKPKEPEIQVAKRKKRDGTDGFTYYKKDDPDKTALGQKDSETVQNAIKAMVLYKKKLAEWKKNNEGTNESLCLYLKNILIG